MLLRVPAATSIAVSSPKHAFKDKVAGNHSLGQLSYQRQKGDLFSMRAMNLNVETNSKPVTGVIFEPFAEVQDELVQVSENYSQSFARQRFDDACEAALNEQINVEYNVSYIYHALFAYFDRDNVGLPGFAKYFKDASDEERDHAVKLMQYLNIRGGKVKLQSILMPVMEFGHPEKGDALYSMELALALEKLNNEKLLKLHNVAAQCNDAQMTDFVEGNFLAKQVEDIKKVSEYVAQLRRIGQGHGVWHFDKMLLNGEGGVAAA